jgi:hypothetical protein
MKKAQARSINENQWIEVDEDPKGQVRSKPQGPNPTAVALCLLLAAASILLSPYL